MKFPSLSILVPYFNEERGLKNVYSTIIKLIKIKKISNYEIIFINDGSTDNSFEILNKIKNKNIIHLNNKKNIGLGYSIKKGMLISKKDFILWVPGDNESNLIGLLPIFKNFGKYDLTITYVKNIYIRSTWRIILSLIYANFIKIYFGIYQIKYFNGLCLYKRKLIKKIIHKVNNNSFSFVTEILIRLLKETNNYQIIGYKIKKSSKRKSGAFSLKNIFFVIIYILKLRFTL